MNRTTPLRSHWQNPVFGWLAACAAATAFASIFLSGGGLILQNPGFLFTLVGFAAVFSLIPAFLTVLFCETYSVRGLASYVIAGVVAAVVVAGLTFGIGDGGGLLFFTCVGGSMGLTYWFVSGRYSGMRFGRQRASE